MTTKDLSPKAIAVYDAVLGLIHKGRDVSVLTVSDIAKAAGIGKGTTYDYFSSKEEIIAKSLIYGYKQLMDQVLEKTGKETTLKDKIKVLVYTAAQYKHTNGIFEHISTTLLSSKEMQAYIKSIFEEERLDIVYFGKVIDVLKQCAKDEGVCPPDKDDTYVSYVLLSVIQVAFGPMSCILSNAQIADLDKQAEYLHRMAERALK